MTTSNPDNSVNNKTPQLISRWWVRPALTLGLVFALGVIGHLMGAREYLNPENVQTTIESAGIWGIVVFAVVFAVGEFLHVPGIVFVAAAIYAYGSYQGAFVAFIGAVVSVTTSFVIVRFIGGQPFEEIQWSYARRMLNHLDERPITTVAFLRVLLWMAPPLNYALAMSSVGFHQYFIGSALGLIPPMIACALGLEWIMMWLA